jgi:catechol 2,3-dioxygenase-like lactoylglutathione lyase family enzyme
MKLGYTLVYVPDVAASLSFFDKAFGLSTRFVHDSGGYGELDTGATTLGFAQHAVARANLGRDYVAADTSDHPLGMEIGLVTDDVAAAYRQALAAGASPLAPPSIKPWGQTVAYVRCPDGTLVELCTAV